MAGHSQYANIKHRKNAQDAKKAKKFTKLRREIITAARSGLPDPEQNAKLRTVIHSAKHEGLSKETIDAALKSASGAAIDDNYDEITYEGYGPEGIACVITALTNNKNRTAADLRHIFTKHGGRLAETGSVTFSFDHVGQIVYEKTEALEAAGGFSALFEFSIEIGALDVLEVKNEDSEDLYIIYCDKKDFSSVVEKLGKEFGQPLSMKLSWLAHNKINMEPDSESTEKLYKMIAAFEDNDDVQSIETNLA